jgi:hypothetical protein
MSRPVFATASLLILLGLSVFSLKHIYLGMRLAPDPSARVWRVDLSVQVDAEGENGRVELVLPVGTHQQVILDEESSDGGLEFTRIERDSGLLGIWSGKVDSRTQLLYSLRAHLPEEEASEASDLFALSDPPPKKKAKKRKADPAIVAMVEHLGLQPGDDPDAVIASTFGFVAHEIETASGGSHDPRVVLATREGALEGKTRLLYELLRQAGIEAELKSGFRLLRSGRTSLSPFVEARSGSRRVRLMVSMEGPNQFPKNFLTLSLGDRPIVSSTGFDGASLSMITLRESTPADEMAGFVSPDSALVRSLSLYRLPVTTRDVLKTLLVIPLATMIAAIFRNFIGVRTFGIFMPVLIAISLREIGLFAGILLISGCLGVGVIGRLLLDRLRLLFVPRVCLLLCLVVLAVTVLAQIGHAYQLPDFGSGLLFPIVILAMLIERISVTTLEEGWQSSAVLLAGSLALVALTYPIFRSEFLGHLFFGFPELVLCVMGVLVLVGGYTGYRITELWRFRALSQANTAVVGADS